MNRVDSVPIAGSAAPALRIFSAGFFIERLPLLQKRLVQSGMPLSRRDKANGAVAIFVIVPLHHACYPAPRLYEIGERLQRMLRPVFQGLEQRFRVRVIVTDGRSTEGRHDAESLQGRQQGSAFHGTAVVGMQNQLFRRYRLTMTQISQYLTRQDAAFRFIDLPAHDLAAENIEKQVQIVELPANGRGQIGNVPAIQLVRRSGAERTRLGAGLSRALATAVRQPMVRPQYPVKSRFGSQVAALIGQPRHNLARRQMPEFLGISDGQYLGTLGIGQGVRRLIVA